jgi:nucleosome binding factor SPN SPT16 subunit
LDLQAYILSCITDGASCKEVFLKGLDYVRKNRPDLEAHLTKNFGFGIGLEFRETEFILNAKNENVLNSGMTLNLALGLQDLSNSNANDAKSQK